jgi:GDPmannose 4,6-dehydratase
MKKKIAFITGITGMVGSHLLDFLIKKTQWDIHGLVRWRSPLNNISHHLDSINKNKRIKLFYGDLNDQSSLDFAVKNSKPNFVFHLAAQSYPLTSFFSPIETYQTNIIGTANLLEILRKRVPNSVIHVCASSEVFGRVAKDKLPIKEDCTFHPASPYAISKVGTDLIGRFYAEAYGLKVMTTRMFTHTGPRRGDVFAESSFAKQIAMIEKGIKSPIIHVGNLSSLRTFADVRDAVRAYYLLVTKNPISGAYYNIGGTHSCKVGDMLKYLISTSKMKNRIQIKIDKQRLRPIDADLQVPDTRKFKKHTGWKPEYTFKQTMDDLLNYWREQINSGNKFLDR